MSLKPMPAVVLFVDDVRRMAQFYRDVAHMVVVHEEAGHAVLEAAGMQLVVHALPPGVSNGPSAHQPVEVREDSYWKLCLPVERIASARIAAAAHGGSIASTDREWVARGFRACDGHDPEGNVIQVREPAD